MFGSNVPEKRWDRGTNSWKSEWYKKKQLEEHFESNYINMQ